MKSHCVVQANLKLEIALSQPHECWYYRGVPHLLLNWAVLLLLLLTYKTFYFNRSNFISGHM
jgi:hypothetical protein